MTMHLLRSLPLCDCVFGCAYFSRIPNDGSIAPHSGPTNIKLRLQLPLVLLSSPSFSVTVAGKSEEYALFQPQ